MAGVGQEYIIFKKRGGYYFCVNINLGEEMNGQLPLPDLGYIYDNGFSLGLSYAETPYPSIVRNTVLVK